MVDTRNTYAILYGTGANYLQGQRDLFRICAY
jgi:hypothetical protein